MVVHTLRAMATGGMYDQLGGGFSRYSVDGEWMVPHFEKMLYDNVQLARVYLNAYQLTGDEGLASIVRETLDFLLDEMRDPEGGFHAALDADSEGIEGKYYVWTADEIRAVAGSDAQLAMAWFGVTGEGNFRDPHHPELTGRNVLSARTHLDELAQRFELSGEEVLARIDTVAEKLLETRAARIRPGLDDKVLTSWNGLALAAFAEAVASWAKSATRWPPLNWRPSFVPKSGRMAACSTPGRAASPGRWDARRLRLRRPRAWSSCTS